MYLGSNSISLSMTLYTFCMLFPFNGGSISNEKANKIYYYNRRLNLVIAVYFFLNAMYSYQNATTEEEKEQEKYLVAATFFILLGALLYLPLGNSNLIIEN